MTEGAQFQLPPPPNRATELPDVTPEGEREPHGGQHGPSLLSPTGRGTSSRLRSLTEKTRSVDTGDQIFHDDHTTTFRFVRMIINGGPIGPSAVALTVFASMGGLLFGYDTGQISDILPMSDFVDRFAAPNAQGINEFSNVRSGLIVGLLSIGTLFGALVGSMVSDALGRRKAMTVGSCFVLIGIAIQISSQHVWQQFAVGRLVAGVGIGGLSGVVPTYQSELAPKNVRGMLVATYQLFITLGILLAYCFGIGTRKLSGPAAWRVLVGLGMVFATILGVGILFMPESPRWLVSRGRFDEAKKSIARVRGHRVEDNNDFVEHDYHEILEAVAEDEKVAKGTWADCFSPRLVKRTMLGILLQMFQQLTGANYFFYYGASIFKGVGIEDSYVTQIILGAVNVVTTFPGLWWLERFGRRRPLIWGGLWQAAWLLVYAIAGTVKDPETNRHIGDLMLVATCLFIAGFASTWGPGIWIVTGEMFPQRNRAKMNSMAVASNWLWNFLLSFFTPFITSDISFSYGFVFAGCNLIGVAIVYLFIKEGAGLSLEHLEILWEDSTVPAWRSIEWVPPGYINRYDAHESAMVAEKPGRFPQGQHVENAAIPPKKSELTTA